MKSISRIAYCCLFVIFIGVNQASELNISFDEISEGVLLDKNWEFYWNELLNPGEIKTGNYTFQLVEVPNSWTTYHDKAGTKYKAYGYATYRIHVTLDKEYENVGIKIPMIWSAAKIFINGNIIYETGKVGDRQEFKNRILSKYLKIPKTSEIDLVVQVSNYSLFVAGILKSFKIGFYEDIKQSFEVASIASLMWIACVLLMALYHIVIYVFRRKNKSTLFFAIISILIFIKLIVFGEHYLYDYLKSNSLLSFKWQSTWYYITTFMLVPVGLYYVESLYYQEVKRKIVNILFFITLSYSIFIFITPETIYAPTLMYFSSINFIGIAYLFYTILLARIRKRPESVIQFAGIIVMIVAGINDALYSKGIELTPFQELIPYAFGIFLCLQFFVIARRFSTALTNEEQLTENLEKKVLERTEEINEKNIELNRLFKNVTDSIHYAKRIQKTILPQKQTFERFLPEHFILYIPKDIVSGDYYYIKMNDNNIILAAIDCTGHGVPGAFVSLVSNNLMNKTIELSSITKPSEILEKLSVDYYQSSEITRDGMDVAILRLDLNHKKIEFAGANNPLYYIRNDELNIIKGDRKPIELFQSTKNLYTNHEIEIKKGDCYYIFTDGFPDQFGGNNESKYKYIPFQKFLLNIHELTMNEQKEALLNEFISWKGNNDQIDDVLIIGLKF